MSRLCAHQPQTMCQPTVQSRILCDHQPYIMCPSTWVATKSLWWYPGGHIVFMMTYILCSSCFCEIWAFCVSWITYDHLHIYIYIYIYIYFMVAAPYIMYKTFQMCCYHQHACLLVCLSLPSAYLSVKVQWMIQVTREMQSNPWIREFWLCCK